MTTNEAARALGVKPVTVRAAIRNGTMTASKDGHAWDITPAAVEAYRANSLGRPGRRPTITEAA